MKIVIYEICNFAVVADAFDFDCVLWTDYSPLTPPKADEKTQFYGALLMRLIIQHWVILNLWTGKLLLQICEINCLFFFKEIKFFRAR